MKQGISAIEQRLLLPPERFASIYCVFSISLERVKFIKQFLIPVSRRNLLVQNDNVKCTRVWLIKEIDFFDIEQLSLAKFKIWLKRTGSG